MSKMYYNIIRRADEKKGERLEYHVSSTKGECADGKSMSKAMNLDHATAIEVADAVERWVDEIRLHSMELDRNYNW